MKTSAEAIGVEGNAPDADYRSHSHDVEAEKPSFTEATVAEGRGGDTRRGLKSRHIQFLYVASRSPMVP